jgi:hypothetical protein
MSRYADQQSLMTVVPGSIQSRTANNVSAVLSGTGTINVFTDSRSTPPNTLSLCVPIVLAPTELALVDFDGLVRTADFLRAPSTSPTWPLYRVWPNH